MTAGARREIARFLRFIISVFQEKPQFGNHKKVLLSSGSINMVYIFVYYIIFTYLGVFIAYQVWKFILYYTSYLAINSNKLFNCSYIVY